MPTRLKSAPTPPKSRRHARSQNHRRRPVNAYKKLINLAHASGVKVIMGTMTPFGDSEHWTTASQQIHDDVNAWIRGGAANGFDGFVDFEKATQDPNKPLSYAPGFDSGDGLHPSHQGKQAMAQALKLTLFQ